MRFIHPQGYPEVFEGLERARKGEAVAFLPPGAGVESAPDAPPENPLVGVCSSGSTGCPRIVWKRWKELFVPGLRQARYRHWTWATCFEPWSFAGIQVALYAWANRGRVMVLNRDWQGDWDRLGLDHAEAVSCTATFMDLLLQGEPNSGCWVPKQITLGGEIVRPRVLERAGARFPKTRITSVYASAEAGVILKTNRGDGWYELGGLEARFKRWKVEQAVLHVCAGPRWIETGDLVEIDGSLIRIVGRRDRVVNVGGKKYSLDEIERLAEGVEGVRRARAASRANDVVGEVVHLTVEPDGKECGPVWLDRVEDEIRRVLPKPAWPRWLALGEVEVRRNGKR